MKHKTCPLLKIFIRKPFSILLTLNYIKNVFADSLWTNKKSNIKTTKFLIFLKTMKKSKNRFIRFPAKKLKINEWKVKKKCEIKIFHLGEGRMKFLSELEKKKNIYIFLAIFLWLVTLMPTQYINKKNLCFLQQSLCSFLSLCVHYS